MLASVRFVSEEQQREVRKRNLEAVVTGGSMDH